MAKAELLIREAVSYAQSEGVVVRPGALFTWENKGLPYLSLVECCATGAVLYALGEVRPCFPKGWLKKLQDALGVDAWWLYRFWMGFDRDFQLLFESGDANSKIFNEDDVSKFGKRLRKELLQNSRRISG